jgi:LacI family transcriptional regulator
MRIREDTRRRVLDVARRLNYHPHASARRLVTGQTRILAYVERQDPEQAFADAFLPLVLRGVQEAASAYGYELLFVAVPVSDDTDRCAKLLQGRYVDGLILSGPRSDDLELCRLIENKSQVVIQGNWPNDDVASVDVENELAASMATEHLIGLGHRRLGVIVHAPLSYTSSAARLAGFRAALQTHALAFEEAWFSLANFLPESGEEALRQIMKQDPRPTALFVTSDTVAIGALRAAHELGIRVPQDLALVGFDDIPMARYTRPSLTTVHLPAFGIGWAAVDLLVRLVTQDDVRETKVVLDTDMRIRDSCGANGVVKSRPARSAQLKEEINAN